MTFYGPVYSETYLHGLCGILKIGVGFPPRKDAFDKMVDLLLEWVVSYISVIRQDCGEAQVACLSRELLRVKAEGINRMTSGR